jgi:hypothetical protein
MGGMRNAYYILVGKPGGKRPFGRPRRTWEDNIRMDVGQIRWEGVDSIHLAHGYGPVAGSCEYGNEPSGSIRVGELLD